MMYFGGKMVRGYQRRIVFLKNTGSRVFDEAYFVIREDAARSMHESTLVEEANRIIDENMGKEGRRAVGFIPFIKRYFLPFILGAVLSTAVFIPIILFL